tara:strand:- start:594 stop:800 length:207 start_codon:yes stop_codon:yes gene_type:complete
MDKPEILGVAEIGKMVGHDRSTIIQWKHKGKLPEPDYVISKTPIWLKDTIVSWLLKNAWVMKQEAEIV